MKYAKLLVIFLTVAIFAVLGAQGGGIAHAQSALPIPDNFKAVNGPNAGEAILTWDAVAGANFYRVGWITVEEAKQAIANQADIYNDYVFVDISGATAYTAAGLSPGTEYYFTVGSLRERFGQAVESNIVRLTLNASGAACPICPTCPTAGTPPGTQPLPVTPVGGDYDADDDGLIEIRSLAQLDAIRYDLDGSGSENDAYVAAFPGAAEGMGCPSSGCSGYELANNLDFDTNRNGQADPGDAYWNGGNGWRPIGTYRSYYYAEFDGNNHTISNLYISRTARDQVGLFGAFRWGGSIRQLRLVAVNVTGHNDVGGLVGYMQGSSSITNSYVTGDVIGNQDIGGLVGENNAAITDSYANSIVSGTTSAGGLVGAHHSGTIARSYSDGEVNTSGDNAGSLVGYSSGTINGSYAIGDVFAVGNSAGGLVGYSSGIINGSYATGAVTGSGWRVGGLVGNNYNGTINGSYATASVTGVHGSVGGLVGAHWYGKINSSYAIGSVTGNVDSAGIGGLVGTTNSRGRDVGGPITLSYWNTETTGQLTSAGSAGSAGKTTNQLQAPTRNAGIYAGWSASWWDFGTSSQYPVLKYGGLSVALQRGAAPSSSAPVPTAPAETDRAALVALYNATSGANWENIPDNEKWLINDPHSSIGDWHGVTTNDDGRVIELRLSGRRLHGEIPTALGELTELTHLDLSANHWSCGVLGRSTCGGLTGSIPLELGQLTNLTHLDLSENENRTFGQSPSGGLTGEIPVELKDLAQLMHLNLSNNSLDGAIPYELGNLTNLDYLDLSDNKLSGYIEAVLRGNFINTLDVKVYGNSWSGPYASYWEDFDGEIEPMQEITISEQSDLASTLGLAAGKKVGKVAFKQISKRTSNKAAAIIVKVSIGAARGYTVVSFVSLIVFEHDTIGGIAQGLSESAGLELIGRQIFRNQISTALNVIAHDHNCFVNPSGKHCFILLELQDFCVNPVLGMQHPVCNYGFQYIYTSGDNCLDGGNVDNRNCRALRYILREVIPS